MTRQAAQAAGAEASRLPLLAEHEQHDATSALLLVTGDRGLAGGFNSQIIRAGVRIADRATPRRACRRSGTRPGGAASPR